MTPDEAIAELDSGLEEAGTLVTLRRESGTQRTPFSCDNVPARVTGFTPDELKGGIVQGARHVVVSPSWLLAKRWCFPPKVGDKVVLSNGRVLNISAVDVIEIAGTAVRVNMVAGG